jgi:hypothetical protein
MVVQCVVCDLKMSSYQLSVFNSGEPCNHKSHPDYAPSVKLNGATGELNETHAAVAVRRYIWGLFLA